MCDKRINVASVSSKLHLGNPTKNCDEIINILNSMENGNYNIIVFPELCISGYTCGDLFLFDTLIDACNTAIKRLVKYSQNYNSHIVVGSPIKNNEKLYDCGIHIYKGKILQIKSKNNLSSIEKRWFSCGYEAINDNTFFDLVVGDDFNTINNNPNIIVNISASPALVTKYDSLKRFTEEYTKQKNCAVIYSSAGAYESSTDFVYSGACFIARCGEIISEGKRFSFVNEVTSCEFTVPNSISGDMNFNFQNNSVSDFDTHPFIPTDKTELEKRCNEIIEIQRTGLARRMLHIHCNKLVLGISGGLDSTLALLVSVKTMERLNYPVSDVICITMPGFGTTDLTYTNACNLVKSLGATLVEISIKDACLQHFKDIGHNVDIHDVTYENTQARERTQILMDYANKIGALVVGTGDLSELALGWCTYNGDHMSMYGVNGSIPKTLMRYLVKYIADSSTENTSKILYSVLDTPVSPELLPPDKNGKMGQKTENTLGSYDAHDYFLYHFLKFKKSPTEILQNAIKTFDGIYSEDELRKWFITFIKRFFNNQFKRSCLPDGVAVGTIGLSPRCSLIMPSDAYGDEWLKF